MMPVQHLMKFKKMRKWKMINWVWIHLRKIILIMEMLKRGSLQWLEKLVMLMKWIIKKITLEMSRVNCICNQILILKYFNNILLKIKTILRIWNRKIYFKILIKEGEVHRLISLWGQQTHLLKLLGKDNSKDKTL